MRVGAADARQSAFFGEDRGLLVGRAADNAGVVGLDPVHLVGDVGQIRAALMAVAAETVERMRDSDQAALLANGRDRLQGG